MLFSVITKYSKMKKLTGVSDYFGRWTEHYLSEKKNPSRRNVSTTRKTTSLFLCDIKVKSFTCSEFRLLLSCSPEGSSRRKSFV